MDRETERELRREKVRATLKIVSYLLSIAMGLGAIFLLIQVDWRIGVGVWLLMWAENTGHALEKKI